MIFAPEIGYVVLSGVAVGVIGAIWVTVAGATPYEQIGAGPLALDVPDNVPPPPLESEAGRAELRQLREGIATVRAQRLGVSLGR